jgi:serine/threonine-protein kinase
VFSPDGTRLAVDIATGSDTDIWVYDWARDASQRLTFEASLEVKPVWSPDGRRIAFSSTRGDKSSLNLHWQRADGTGQVQRLTESGNNQFAGSWHPSGKFLAFAEQNPQTGMDIMILPIDGDEVSGWKPGTPRPFVNSTFVEQEPVFSPDGHWLAYMSNDSGATEIYVRPFPGPGGLQLISAGSGVYPMWSRTKPEIFYGVYPNQQFMAVAYATSGDSFRADKPRLWSTSQFQPRPRVRSFNVHPDGERIAVAAAPTLESAAKQNQVVFILNFFDELKRLGSVTR